MLDKLFGCLARRVRNPQAGQTVSSSFYSEDLIARAGQTEPFAQPIFAFSRCLTSFRERP